MGIFLGISGRKRKFLIIGKDVVEVHNEWGATQIPLELVEEITFLMPREQVMRLIREIHSVDRRVKLRKYSKEGCRTCQNGSKKRRNRKGVEVNN